ncbi:hypothetical protein NQ318_007068 [Aromia moschata]|uniref:DUF4817 domain-containing protein n=1 Tax=Aromia moschata TaxID=1265417 RepID=A0AAV8X8V5_9CUCU|nr:hypothetical protein NQ318_007068 [Aromia moschata]
MSLSDTQRIEILILLGCGDTTRTQKQVCEIFNTTYPDRRISHSTVSGIENKFREFGNVTDIPKSAKKRILDDEQKLDIFLDIQDNPHKPTRQVAADNDNLTTMTLIADWNFEKSFFFSDEATFVLNGTVNKHNWKYWSTENTHWMMEANTQYPEKVNVWAGIVNSQIIRLYFFDGTLTGSRYLDFLQNFLVLELRMIMNYTDHSLKNAYVFNQYTVRPISNG